MSDLLTKAKSVLDITSDYKNVEIEDLIQGALFDLGIAGVDGELVSEADPLIIRAVMTYVSANFPGQNEKTYARLKASYDEQKAQLQMATGYTDWGGIC